MSSCLFVQFYQHDEQCSPSEVITIDQQGAQFEPAPLSGGAGKFDRFCWC